MISREPAGRVATRHGGEGIAAGDGPRSIARSERAAKISAGALRAERSRRARAAYASALRALAAIKPEALELSPAKIVAALKILRRHLLPGSPADIVLAVVLDCRAERTLEQFLRRNPDLLAAVRREARS